MKWCGIMWYNKLVQANEARVDLGVAINPIDRLGLEMRGLFTGGPKEVYLCGYPVC